MNSETGIRLIECPACKNPVSEMSAACPKCGQPIRAGAATTQSANPAELTRLIRENQGPPAIRRNRGVYIILAILLGTLGIHNFYAGRLAQGAIQLVLTLTLGWFVVPWIVVALWAIAEAITVKTDGKGVEMG